MLAHLLQTAREVKDCHVQLYVPHVRLVLEESI